MTAYRVIDDHTELSNIGSLTHVQIDGHVSGTTFLYVSGSAPPQGRRIVAGTNVSIVDGGPGGDLTISSTGGGSPGTLSLTSWMELPSGLVDGSNQIFSLSNAPSPSTSLMFFVNGVLQKQGSVLDYTLAGSTVSMLYAPNSGSNLAATYQYDQVVYTTQTSWMETPTGDVDSMNMVFTVANTPNPPGSLMFFVNGVLQRQGASADYTLAGDTIVLNYAPATGSNITATYPY